MGEEGTTHKFYMIQDNELVEVPSPITTAGAISPGIVKLVLEEKIERLSTLLRAREEEILDLRNILNIERHNSEEVSLYLKHTEELLVYYKRKPRWFNGPFAYWAWRKSKPRSELPLHK